MFSFFQSIFHKVTTVIATAAIAIGLISAPEPPKQPVLDNQNQAAIEQQAKESKSQIQNKQTEVNSLVEIEKLKQEIEELKKKPATVTNNLSSPTPPPIETWVELEAKYFVSADQKGWTSQTITNALGEKRYYRKEGNLWVRKNSEAEIQQPYISPPTLNQLTRLIRMCSSAPEAQAICDKPEFMPGYYSNLAFRTAIDGLVVEYEDIIANQQKQVVSTYILPPIQLPSSVFSSPLPLYTPPPTYYIPLSTYLPLSTGRIDFSRDPRTGRIYSSSNGVNYFYDLNGRLDHANGPNGTTQINYNLSGNIDSISF